MILLRYGREHFSACPTFYTVFGSPARDELYQSFQLFTSNLWRIECAWNSPSENLTYLHVTQLTWMIQFDKLCFGGKENRPLGDPLPVGHIPQSDCAVEVTLRGHLLLDFLRWVAVPSLREVPKPRRYHGSVDLDPTRVGRDAGRVADEVIAHLAGLVGSSVRVTLEIQADVPTGAPDNVVRTVTENSQTLKFLSYGFEDE
jgi:hypothetical protein